MESTLRLKAVTLMEGDRAVGLVVQIAIECDVCGPHRLTLAGHHVRPVIELLQEVLCRDPELTDAGTCVSTERSEGRIYPENN
jgi:hypothetical protein